VPLPVGGETPWPPAEFAAITRDVDEWAAWYSGDAGRLAAFYGTTPTEAGTDQRPRRARFWTKRAGDPAGGGRIQLHVPIASDLAATSADLLFGDPVEIRIPDAGSETEATATQERWDTIRDRSSFDLAIIEGAEVAAALGGVYLRVGWDRAVADTPLITAVHADAAVPTFAYGRLVAVTLWRVVLDNGGEVWRHLERHEPGRILHGLYAGDARTLGARIPLDSHPETEGLDPEVILPAEMGGRLTVAYVPNVRPNRRHRSSWTGRSDYAQAEPMLDALDEAWTSWMRDLRLGVARIVVAEDFLRRTGRGGGATFDLDDEIYSTLNLDPETRDRGDAITPVQFAIRVDEHERTTTSLMERIVTNAGYAPQTFGLHIEGRAESGTALNVRERKTIKTRARKAAYWTPALQETVATALAVDRFVLGNRVAVPTTPIVSFSDPFVEQDGIETVARSVEMLQRAQAISMQTAVRMAQPDLDDGEVDAEVERIRDQYALGPDPVGTLGV
jgi:A118 family predicted phage portal protein